MPIEPEVIQEDQEPDQLPQRMPNPRDAMIAEIASRSVPENDPSPEPPDGYKPPGVQQSEPQDEDEEPAPDEEVTAEPEPEELPDIDEETLEKILNKRTRKLKVDGQEGPEVSLSELLDAGLRTKQVGSTADKRLEEATRLFKEAEERAKQNPPQGGSTSTEQADDPNDADVVSIQQAIAYGTDEEGQEAVRKLLKAVAGGTAKPQDRQYTEADYALIREIARNESRTREIEEKFFAPKDKGGFADLGENKYFLGMVNDNVNEKLANGAPESWETYKKAGEEVRINIAKALGVSLDAPDASLAAKTQKKRKADNVRPSATPSSSGGDKAPLTTSDIITQMRKSRGQA